LYLGEDGGRPGAEPRFPNEPFDFFGVADAPPYLGVRSAGEGATRDGTIK